MGHMYMFLFLWENKQKAPYEVGKMDKHIVRGDEVGNDDDSLDDNHVSLFVIKPLICSFMAHSCVLFACLLTVA